MKNTLCLMVVLGSGLYFAERGAFAAEGPVFLRGDANSDGTAAISDAVMVRRYIFNGDRPPACMDAADADDNGSIDLADMVSVLTTLFLDGLFLDGGHIAAPFPAMGADETPDDGLPCESAETTPAQGTEDLIRIGDVTASPGEDVLIPVYLTNSLDIDALQMVVKYDPAVFTPVTGGTAFDYAGTPWESSFDGVDDDWFQTLRAYPEDQVFVLGIVSNIINTDFEIPPGSDTVIFRIKGKVSENAQPGTTVILEPTNGAAGQGLPPAGLKNELTHRGDARYVSFIPRLEPGSLAIVDDIGFFVRGDTNSDQIVDISDAGFLFNYLFLGGPQPRCLDSADSDDSGSVDITDAVVILSNLFTGESRISPPYPSKGRDDTLDSLAACPK